ncbi:MAG: sel1 repeat family protein [Alphaproteobacteria bacterium]|jgi:TPR repeat protein|nr:sel1 repeat family protein [Alphaproteobacteria bacterium]
MNDRSVRCCILTIVIAALIQIHPAQADFAAGAQAYDGGDYATAFEEWQKAAQKGDLTAMVALADLYRRGAGRRPDVAQAFDWYQRAAKAGNGIAQMNLGEMYLNGWGIKADRLRAWIWFDRAAAQGLSWAQKQRSILEKSISPAELAKARKIRKIAP